MNDILEKYIMLTAWSITQKARMIDYGPHSFVAGYDTTYGEVGSRMNLKWLGDRLAVL